MNLSIKINQTLIILLVMIMFGVLSSCSSPAPVEPTQPPDRVDVVYFYDSEICQCEAAPGVRIQGTLYINFSKELANGQLTFQSIDINDPNYAAITNKYRAKSLSLFLNVVRGDTEQTVAVPEIVLVKDDDEAIGRLIVDRISKYFEVD